jgi:molybdopterin-biosynthesis enzyme MoeA-like protein
MSRSRYLNSDPHLNGWANYHENLEEELAMTPAQIEAKEKWYDERNKEVKQSVRKMCGTVKASEVKNTSNCVKVALKTTAVDSDGWTTVVKKK